MSDKIPVRVLLSLPRTGTHFFWTRSVNGGQCQLIYDADRVPALVTLGRICSDPLPFLASRVSNPNYNFQYNSMPIDGRARTARAHLDGLFERYAVGSDPEMLFHRIMTVQDRGRRTLLSINRFVYTTRYTFLAPGFPYTIDHALDALRTYVGWLARGPYDPRIKFIVRPIEQWIRSQEQMMGARSAAFIRERLEDFPAVMGACRELDIPVYSMDPAIAAVKDGGLEFERRIPALTVAEIETMVSDSRQWLGRQAAIIPQKAPFLRPARFFQYLVQRDPAHRASLVRSIGDGPLRLSRFVPILGRMIRDDYEGVGLNNARVLERPAATPELA